MVRRKEDGGGVENIPILPDGRSLVILRSTFMNWKLKTFREDEPTFDYPEVLVGFVRNAFNEVSIFRNPSWYHWKWDGLFQKHFLHTQSMALPPIYPATKLT